MAGEKTINRWMVVVGALVIQLCLGAIYAWSVFTPKLKAAVADGGFGFTATQTQVVFSVGLATFAVVMVLAGRWQAKIGPRLVALTGGILLGIGYILAKFLGGAFIGQVICIGLIGGAGIGLAYVCPIAVGMKWFPDKKGMISGLAVAGFGFGALLWVKLAGQWAGLIGSLGCGAYADRWIGDWSELRARSEAWGPPVVQPGLFGMDEALGSRPDFVRPEAQINPGYSPTLRIY